MRYPRQEYWSGLPSSPPGDLPDPGIEPTSPVSPVLQVDSLPLSHLGSPTWSWLLPKVSYQLLGKHIFPFLIAARSVSLSLASDMCPMGTEPRVKSKFFIITALIMVLFLHPLSRNFTAGSVPALSWFFSFKYQKSLFYVIFWKKFSKCRTLEG